MIKKDKPLLYDPNIITRVKQYLEDNVHQTYVDVAVMAQDLQDKYKEYNKRKAGAFRIQVEQAYKTVLHSYGLDSNPSSDEEGDVNSDLELMDDAQSKGSDPMNDALQSLYMNNKGNKRAPATAVSQGESINISSDESGDEGAAKKHPILSKVTPDIIVTKIQKQMDAAALKTPPSVAKPADVEPVAKKRKIDGPAELKKDAKVDTKTAEKDEARPEPPPAEIPTDAQAAKGRKGKKDAPAKSSTVKFANFGGNEKILDEIWKVLLYFKRPKLYRHIGKTPPKGLLLHGPPGSGKTLLAHAIAGQLKVPIVEVAATELVTGISGDSEKHIRRIFDQVVNMTPCVLFIDEIDVISSHRNNAQKDMERRIVTQLIFSMDSLEKVPNGDQVLVIGATSRVEALDPSLRRGGRFDWEICLGIPDREARADILRVICDKMPLERPFDFDALAALTPGFVGVDLETLTMTAASVAFMKLILAKDGKALLEKYSKTHERQTVPVVDLDEDPILMETDDVSSSTRADKQDGDPEIVIDDDDVPEKSNQAEKEAEKKPEEVIKENGSAEVIPEKTEEEKKDEPMDTAEEIPPETAKIPEDGQEVVPAAVKQVDEKVEEKNTPEEPKEVQEKVPEEKEEPQIVEEKKQDIEENGDVTIVSGEGATIDITESPKKSLPEHTQKPQKQQNSAESLAESLLKDPKFLLQLSLDEKLNLLEKDTEITETDLENFCISMDDFREALKTTQPVAKREGFITVPDVTWQDIGSLWDIRKQLKLAVTSSVKCPKLMKALKLEPSCGVLLCGPPGCGKTLLAKAVANEVGINFISVKGPELLNMYVGESERAVRQCFLRARYSAPCVIFFDEFDALCPKRSSRTENTGATRVVNQLLTEMDGMEDRKGVFVLAATNRPDMIDSAVLRPGRFDKILFVSIPRSNDRCDILKALTKNGTEPRLAEDVDLEELAVLTEGYTGADLAGLLRQAAMKALEEYLLITTDDSDDIKVTKKNFLQALDETKPSVSSEELEKYEKLRIQYSSQSG
ncbi:nuclear valosin-containing protein-like [Lutzomyia longipalpis]|uniref:nuclear valosin-containing protein-like n=1 Tax=Lutzomyia longipalpis TaxID=7200 RepID=UPI0024838EBA|nr:nuclear valosin-containing protein-like [Lutzomyia longipalpis]